MRLNPSALARSFATNRQVKARDPTRFCHQMAQRPTWLDLAHKKLDAAVFAAYGWPADLSDDEILARLLELNLERAGQQG